MNGDYLYESFERWYEGSSKITPSGVANGETVVDAIVVSVNAQDNEDEMKALRTQFIKSWTNSDGGTTAIGRVAAGKVTCGTQVIAPPYHVGDSQIATMRDTTQVYTAWTFGIYVFTFDNDNVDLRPGSVIAELDELDGPASGHCFLRCRIPGHLSGSKPRRRQRL